MNRSKRQDIGIWTAMLVVLVGYSLLPGVSQAQQADADARALFQDIETDFAQAPDSLDLKITLTYSETSGNSNTSSGSGTLHLDRFWANKWGFVLLANGTYSTSRDVGVDAENYGLDMAVTRKLSERFSLVLLEEWHRNRLAGLDNQLLVTVAGLWHMADKPKWQLAIHAGLGSTHEEFSTGAPDDDYTSGLLEIQNGFVISKAASGLLKMTYHHDFDDSENYRFNGDLSLQAAINSRVQLTVAYSLRFDNQPVLPLTSRTDTLFSTGVTIQLTKKKQSAKATGSSG